MAHGAKSFPQKAAAAAAIIGNFEKSFTLCPLSLPTGAGFFRV